MRLFFSGPRILGIRPGVILGPGDLTGGPGKVDGAFLYAITDPRGQVKIGVTKNPRRRLDELQVGSPYQLRFLQIWATPGEGYDVELEAHVLLERFKTRGEWFKVGAANALASVELAASRLSAPLLRVSLEQVDQILVVAASQATPKRGWLRTAALCLLVLGWLRRIFRA
jgi:hypothetical protein